MLSIGRLATGGAGAGADRLRPARTARCQSARRSCPARPGSGAMQTVRMSRGRRPGRESHRPQRKRQAHDVGEHVTRIGEQRQAMRPQAAHHFRQQIRRSDAQHPAQLALPLRRGIAAEPMVMSMGMPCACPCFGSCSCSCSWPCWGSCVWPGSCGCPWPIGMASLLCAILPLR